MAEFELTRKLAQAYGSSRCSCYDACPVPGTRLVANIDGYSMKHSRLPWMTMADWGWKATVAAISDILASGGRPLACMISIGLPSPAGAVEAVEAAGAACRSYGAAPLKGDYNSSQPGGEWIDVAVIGESSRPMSRCGARPGDLVVQLGYTGYGLASRLLLENILAIDQVPGEVLDYTRRPTPPAQSWRITAGYANAAIDNSDGAGYSLALLAAQSSVIIIVDEIVAHPKVEELIEDNGINRDALALSWEDYNIFASIPEDNVGYALKECREYDVPCWVIGRIEKGKPAVYIDGKPFKQSGWNWTYSSPI